ncbi:hypothetical protein N657DRAFT_454933 [Parathielavia appendiculata]|uniref:Uncharacterized protein n=1 Tax=Parathielavia appendiculata TaxID=2587402 RepID=A0AAN6TZR0_9PEZI|nr:hypothetical protein N657DRAFT_454933 [Parathielavia appendiculata]
MLESRHAGSRTTSGDAREPASCCTGLDRQNKKAKGILSREKFAKKSAGETGEVDPSGVWLQLSSLDHESPARCRTDRDNMLRGGTLTCEKNLRWDDTPSSLPNPTTPRRHRPHWRCQIDMASQDRDVKDQGWHLPAARSLLESSTLTSGFDYIGQFTRALRYLHGRCNGDAR